MGHKICLKMKKESTKTAARSRGHQMALPSATRRKNPQVHDHISNRGLTQTPSKRTLLYTSRDLTEMISKCRHVGKRVKGRIGKEFRNPGQPF